MITRDENYPIITKNEINPEIFGEIIYKIHALSNDMWIIQNDETLSLWNQKSQTYVVRVDISNHLRSLKLVSPEELFCVDYHHRLIILDPRTLQYTMILNGHNENYFRLNEELIIGYDTNTANSSVYGRNLDGSYKYKLTLSSNLFKILKQDSSFLKKIQDNKFIAVRHSKRSFCIIEFKNKAFVRLINFKFNEYEEHMTDIINLPRNRLAICVTASKTAFSKQDFKEHFNIYILSTSSRKKIRTLQLDNEYEEIQLLSDERTIIARKKFDKSTLYSIDIYTNACKIIQLKNKARDFTMLPNGNMLAIVKDNEIIECDFNHSHKKFINTNVKSILDAFHRNLSNIILSYVDNDYALSSYSGSLFNSVMKSNSNSNVEPLLTTELDLDNFEIAKNQKLNYINGTSSST